MTDKAYIVANKEQEIDVLTKFEQKDLIWLSGDNATEWVLSENSLFNSRASFPYALIERGDEKIAWLEMGQLTDEEITYDGRKEEKMYKVTQGFMDELIEWRDDNDLYAKGGAIDAFVDDRNIQSIPEVIGVWWTDSDNPTENNNRLIAIIKWLNGENVFEVEKPHKFVVRSDKSYPNGKYRYVMVEEDITSFVIDLKYATNFDTREEAQEWANSHQVVVEIDEDGNEVE